MSTGKALPPTLAANPRLGDWLRIAPDGTVEVRSGKVELGQGVLTALAQMAAEELDVDVGRVRMTSAATDLSPDEGITAGSLSIQQSGAALREVCAEARDLYLTIAAEKLAVPKEDLTVTDGRITGSDGSATSYWELADETVLDRPASGGAKPKPDSDYRVVGTDVSRIDLPDKLAGRPRYVHDLQFDGMVYGRVVRPPSRGATLTALDTGPTRQLSGVVTVVREGDFVGVIAEREEVAVRAEDRLRADATWEQNPSLPDDDDLPAFLTGAAADTTVLTDGSPVKTAHRSSSATYHRPFIAHGSIAPSCAVALAADGELQIWSHSQGVHNLRREIARVGNAAGAVGGAPRRGRRVLRPQWRRRRRDGRRAARAGRAGQAGTGGVVACRRTGVGAAGNRRSGPDLCRDRERRHRVVMAARDLERHLHQPPRHDTAPGIPGHQPPRPHRNPLQRRTSVGARGRHTAQCRSRVRLSVLRSGQPPDPGDAVADLRAAVTRCAPQRVRRGIVHGRARRGRRPRSRRVPACPPVRPARPRGVGSRRKPSNWAQWTRSDSFGHGIGYARYKNSSAYCAVVAEVEAVEHVQVRRLTIAVDAGLVISPDGAANQIEGGAIQATSWTLKERVRFDRYNVTSDNWEAYPILRFSEVPAVDVEFVPGNGNPPLGVGECAQGPTAAAIANAVFDALGVRVRSLPLTAEQIVAAMPN